jgi:uncharacterized protein (DUF433 family)
MIFGDHPEERAWRTLSVEELAALAEVPSRRVREELAQDVLPEREEGSPRHRFGTRDVFYFLMVKHLESALTLSRSTRRALHLAIDRHHPHTRPANDNLELKEPVWRKTATGWELVAVQGEFDARQPFAEAVRRVRRYVQGKRRLEQRDDVLGGEPVFKGTRIAVRSVGELVKRGIPYAELKEDHPSLSDEDLDFAALFASLPRPPGRPRKALVARREGT